MNIKTNLRIALQISRSNKDFILFNLTTDNKIRNYMLTNDLKHKNKYKHFRVISCIKRNINTITI